MSKTVRHKQTLVLLTLGLATVLVSPASGAARIAKLTPASVTVPRADIPGFAAAKVQVMSTTSAVDYNEDRAAALKREGFQQGVVEAMNLRRGLAIILTEVFHTAHGAEQAFGAEVAELSVKPSLDVRFKVRAIPGSLALRELNLRDPSGYIQNADLVFSTGRCVEDVAITYFTRKSASTPRGLDDAAAAGATALYRRVKRICA
jgi:hypothetical protein